MLSILQGMSKVACVVDNLEVGYEPKKDDAIAACVRNSRSKSKEGMLIMQPFSPALFRLGSPAGPNVLMKLLCGEIGMNDVDAKVDDLDKPKLAEKSLLRMPWECRSCHLAGEPEEQYMKSMREFNVRSSSEFMVKLLP